MKMSEKYKRHVIEMSTYTSLLFTLKITMSPDKSTVDQLRMTLNVQSAMEIASSSSLKVITFANILIGCSEKIN